MQLPNMAFGSPFTSVEEKKLMSVRLTVFVCLSSICKTAQKVKNGY